ncbi:MAG: CarD family transcriptional regulator [Oscillospiraceae bacterium]|nr:CarD family transcriptional regulator [Oscillospiraceae bacterium]
MFNIGDLIVYGGEGVCKVDAIGIPSSSMADLGKIYYTLSPLYRDGQIFTPTDTKVFMRPVMSREEVEGVIENIPNVDAMPVAERDPKQTERTYREFISSHRCNDMIAVIKAVHIKRGEGGGTPRKTSQTDERYLRMAEDLLYGEFAVALDIPRDDVRKYVETRVENIITTQNA